MRRYQNSIVRYIKARNEFSRRRYNLIECLIRLMIRQRTKATNYEARNEARQLR